MQPTHMQAQKTIDGIEFPTTRTTLVEYARGRGADGELLGHLNQLPDRLYLDPNEVGAAFARVTGE
jgi:hypothetical protein